MNIKGLNGIFKEFTDNDVLLKTVKDSFRKECEGKTDAEIRELAQVYINHINAQINILKSGVSDFGNASFAPNSDMFSIAGETELNALKKAIIDSRNKQFDNIMKIHEYYQSVILNAENR